MIHINLLAGPRGRKAKGQADFHVEAIAAVVCVVLTMGGSLFYSNLLAGDIEARQLDMQEKTKQIEELKKKVKKVTDLEVRKKQLEAKTRVIEQLEKRRGGRVVRALDSVSRSLEPLKLWIVNLTLKGQQVEIQGVALENDDVIGFVNNLRRGGLFQNINLREIRSSTQAKTKVLKFRLGMSLKG